MEKRTIEIKNPQQFGGLDLVVKSGDKETRISPMDTIAVELQDGGNTSVQFVNDNPKTTPSTLNHPTDTRQHEGVAFGENTEKAEQRKEVSGQVQNQNRTVDQQNPNPNAKR